MTIDPTVGSGRTTATRRDTAESDASLFDRMRQLPSDTGRLPTVGDLPEIVPAAGERRPSAEVVRIHRRPRVRRVTRVVRHVDTWSVFKVAVVFSVFLYVVALTSGVLLWQVAENSGTLDNVERFFESFGWQSFELNGGEIYHNAWIAGLFAAVGLTGAAVLVATLFNLVSDLVGGVRVSVLEEEVEVADPQEVRAGGPVSNRRPGRTGDAAAAAVRRVVASVRAATRRDDVSR